MLINKAIALEPMNWIKIPLMLLFFLVGAEFVAQIISGSKTNSSTPAQ